MKKIIFSIIALLILSIITWQLILSPTHDKNWREANKNLPSISIEENIITLENYRDFWIDENGIENNTWETRIINIDDIEGMDFIISHFSEYEGIAHSFVSFRIKSFENIGISMEVRLEDGVEYSPFRGTFNQFEMMYVVGSERDLIGSRIGHRDEEVFLYETVAEAKASQELFLRFAEEINTVKKNPIFYNTIWNNCTSVIVGVIENQIDKNIWWSYEHLLPGYVDKKAFEMDFLKNDSSITFDELKEESRISGKGILQWSENFENKIREYNE